VVNLKAVADMGFSGFVLIVKKKTQTAKNFLMMNDLAIGVFGDYKEAIRND